VVALPEHETAPRQREFVAALEQVTVDPGELVPGAEAPHLLVDVAFSGRQNSRKCADQLQQILFRVPGGDLDAIFALAMPDSRLASRAPARHLAVWIDMRPGVLIFYAELNGSFARADAAFMTRSLRLVSLFLLLAPATASAREPNHGSRLRPAVLERALHAFARLEAAGRVRNRLLTVIDYALPSSQRRLWVLEPGSLKVLFHEFVAHGKGSSPAWDPDRAVRFGNQMGSFRSSLGTFLTGDAYSGEHGYSLRLEGLDPGLNDLAAQRAIVIHPADYVTTAFRARSGGRLGRSWGCPALDPVVAPAIIDRIQAGSVVYATGPGG